MAVAAEALFQLVQHPSVADAVHQPYQPVQIYHCFCHLKASKLQPVDCRTIAKGPVSPTFACMPSNRGDMHLAVRKLSRRIELLSSHNMENVRLGIIQLNFRAWSLKRSLWKIWQNVASVSVCRRLLHQWRGFSLRTGTKTGGGPTQDQDLNKLWHHVVSKKQCSELLKTFHEPPCFVQGVF